MDCIPPEVLLHIFEFLDGPAPSQVRLRHQPSDDMLHVKPQLLHGLKNASLVSRAWRILALPNLFRHILWRPKISSLRAFTMNPIPLLQFLEDNKLDRGVITFTLIVDFVDKEADARHTMPEIRTVDLEWLWDQLFSVIDPLRFTIIAPPTTLAAFMSRMLFLDDAWSFSIPYHILSLARTTRGPGREKPADVYLSDLQLSPPEHDTRRAAQPASASPPTGIRYRNPPSCPLFTVRPWTSILLNEGSSTRVYRTYEFFLRRPPSMLGALLGCEEHPNDTPLVPPTVVDFNYIAIFPLSSHFEVLVQHLPKVERLFVQLTPGPENLLILDDEEMHHVDSADLWMERNTAYSSLMRELTLTASPMDQPRNWASLQVFESGDTADIDAWNMAVDFVKRSGVKDWKVEREGVFVKYDDDGKGPITEREIDGHIAVANSPEGLILDH
ncbi:uncharacterized protein GGS22DRAFT_102308 [Annulohypoxylon maeteangense]|uniref:uncharacterized protein n=1 Tax=Annulohypoxylon maeteangense TaxID=1927788 RepID=UPI002008C438|nr:uncharacterized protein GGS22DRAFT_102308 [Annulohypoxylon maeteangense]KAI0879935.1 hypothetical protein GGS22DRAFT_102308 [Annulohypoxylon maeteangense]